MSSGVRRCFVVGGGGAEKMVIEFTMILGGGGGGVWGILPQENFNLSCSLAQF